MVNTSRVHNLWRQHDELSLLCAEMHQTGMHFNQHWRDFLIHCVQETVTNATEVLARLVNDDAWKPTSHTLRSLVFEKHKKPGLKCFGMPSPTDPKCYTSETLDTIAVNERSLLLLLVGGDCPPELSAIIEAWWNYQGEVKRLGMLQSHLLDKAVGLDGRLRPGWNSCGTDTGRFSCSAPNVMNVEQDMRVLFGPPPGRVWVHGDKSQLELRVMASVACDNVLQDALDTGDVYTFDAVQMFGVDPKKVPKDLRKGAKIIHLGRQYGAGIKTIFGQALRSDRRFTLERTKQFIKAWDKLYYRTTKYWDEEMAQVLERGYSASLIMDRRRTYPLRPDRSEVANYPVQSTAADVMNQEILQLWYRLREELPSARIVAQVHDAIDIEANESDVEIAKRILGEVMNSEVQINGRYTKLPTEIKVAYHKDTWQSV